MLLDAVESLDVLDEDSEDALDDGELDDDSDDALEDGELDELTELLELLLLESREVDELVEPLIDVLLLLVELRLELLESELSPVLLLLSSRSQSNDARKYTEMRAVPLSPIHCSGSQDTITI